MLYIISRSLKTLMRTIPSAELMYRLATAGPVVSASRTSPLRLGMGLCTMQWLVRSHAGKCHAIGIGPSRLSLTRSQETQTEEVELELPNIFYPPILCAIKCQMIRPWRYSTLQNRISGYQPKVGSDRVAFDKDSWPYVGQRSIPKNRD